jgi:hypothetical protein
LSCSLLKSYLKDMLKPHGWAALPSMPRILKNSEQNARIWELGWDFL